MSTEYEGIRKLLKCCVCLEEIHNQKVLPCQHSACPNCISQIISVGASGTKCPICQKGFAVPEEGVDGFPDNLTIRQLIDIIKQEKTTPNNETDSNSRAKDKQAREDKSPRCSKQPSEENLDKKQLQKRSHQERKNAQKKLKKTVAATLDQTDEWMRESQTHVARYRILKADLEENVKTSTDTIRDYQKKINLKAQEKVAWLAQANEEYEKDLGAFIQETEIVQQQISGFNERVAGLREKMSEGLISDKEEEDIHEYIGLINSKAKPFYNLYGGEQFKPGDHVQLNPINHKDDSKKLLENPIPYNSVGIFLETYRELIPSPMMMFMPMMPLVTHVAVVVFPGGKVWIGRMKNLIKTRKACNLPYLGDRVRIKPSGRISELFTSSRAPTGSGIIREIEEEDSKLYVEVEFPNKVIWSGLYSDVEKIKGCGFQVGDKVRISSATPEPSSGWQGINGSSVGTIKKLDEKGKTERQVKVVVSFTGGGHDNSNWEGMTTDLMMTREPQTQDVVQVKLSVGTPKYGWGDVTHDHVGILENVLEDEWSSCAKRESFFSDSRDSGVKVAQVRFPGRHRTWDCLLQELEIARFQTDTVLEEVFTD